ncbi:MAG: ATP-binding protein [Prevotella sp.]|jgi:predicted AAA+ superfamily ATPase|nr:ATP-binding protein [uncultured Prevotella sp.]MBD9299243.1 ATP-binding protein [Prevotella sp.]
MIEKETIKEILLENRKEIESQQVVHRNIEKEDFANYVLIGVRRAGKSFMLYQQIQDNLKKGITWDSMLYINFEDERLIGMTAQELNLILEVHGMMSAQRPILFLDEIQNIEGWDKFARRLADNKYRVYITGSNAKMLSSDVATTLGGRYITKHILPYSFSEYLSANNIPYDDMNIATTSGRADVQRYFAEYFRFGGFPEGAQLASKRDYLNSVYQKIYIGDIATRNKIDNLFSLRILFRKMAESVKQPTSFTRLSNIIASTGAKLGKATIINYIEYSKDAFLIYPIKNIADNLTNRETNPKYYFVDNGIISILALDIDTSLLENMVAMELIRRYGIDERVFFYNRNIEVDFYIPDAALAIQVSYNPHKTDETWQRESTALIKFTKVLDCQRLLILSYDTEETVEVNGKTIEVMPVWKWLIQDLSKIF